MKIELNKDVKLYKMEFVGEVDFFDKESPYIKLLNNMETEDDLIDELMHKNMSEPAIKNIINRLKDLKVLKNGYIKNVKSGFPEKEYGKYTLEIFQNNTRLPFRNKNKKIQREKAVSRNTSNNIQQNESFIKIVQDKINKDFRINTIENDKANLEEIGDSKLIIRYINKDWQYIINDKNFKMEHIDFTSLFKGEWDSEYNALKIGFSLIKEDYDTIKSFKKSFSDNIELENYGNLKAKFQDVNIIPKTQYDAKEWFIYLLKDEIEQLNRYISKIELNELWENTKEKYSIFKRFDWEFNFEMILKEFGKNSKYYWLLQAGIDLYPFDSNTVPKDRVLIENMEDFNSNFHIDIKELIVMDRYLNTKRHFYVFENILKKLDNPTVTIFTTENHLKKESKEIKNFINKNNIKRIIKDKNEIEHTRHWIVNDEFIYRTPESIDGIHNTSFDLYEKGTIEKIAPKVINLLSEAKQWAK